MKGTCRLLLAAALSIAACQSTSPGSAGSGGRGGSADVRTSTGGAAPQSDGPHTSVVDASHGTDGAMDRRMVMMNEDAGTKPDRPRDAGSPGRDARGADVLLKGCTGNETFASAQAAMLSSCSSGRGSVCHTPVATASLSAHLDLSSSSAFANLVGVPSYDVPSKLRVKPYSPSESFLVQKLTNQLGPGEGVPMPNGESALWLPPDPAKLTVLECWIALGARKN